MTTHARFAPSAAHRWVNCPPSLRLEERFPNRSSSYALEGAAAHEVCRLYLDGEDIDALQTVRVPDEDGTVDYVVTPDMRGHARAYAAVLAEHVGRVNGALLVERRVGFGSWIDVPDQYGTSDAIILGGRASNEIIVVDYKYGSGVAVHPKDNEQLMLYALGAMYEYEHLGDWQTITMIIVQPRAGDGTPKKYTVTADELRAFAEKAKRSAQQALAGEGDFHPSEDTCRFCRAKTVCPALQKEVDETVVDDFTGLIAGTPEAREMARDAGLLTAEKLGFYMDRVGMIEDWCKAVRAEVERMLVQGDPVPGWKLVRGRMGDRAWASTEDAEAALKKMRLKAADIFTRKLINPTAAERLLKKTNPAGWERLQSLITRAEGKLSVAPASDHRPAESAAVATDDFRQLIDQGT